MPKVPTTSTITGEPTPSYFVHTLSGNFVDNAGRTLLLRGVNLSGSSKAPVNRQSYIQEDFWEAAERGGESFIGRPLELEPEDPSMSADVHLARLRGWGFNCLRYPVTWEALEHEGPGKYDYDFMDYTIRVLQKCKEHGFKVFMDPHADVWSRFSGGSGAPYWTLPACGINARNFTATQAAIVHCEYPTPDSPDPQNLPAMVWSTNYGRLLSKTLYTLFFAGRDYAPKCIIDGENIQDYLQKHFIEAFGALADRIKEKAPELLDETIIGWDSMNEPAEGWIGWEDLNVAPTTQGSTLRKGTYPTPAQSLRLGMGKEQTVDNWKFGSMGPQRDGTVTIDPQGRTIWATAEELDEDPSSGFNEKWGWTRSEEWTKGLGTCLWAYHGVWDVESGYVLIPDYFNTIPAGSSSASSSRDDLSSPGSDSQFFIPTYWVPHFTAYLHRIRRAHPEAILFVQPPVFAIPTAVSEDVLQGRAAYSAHYYDGLTLVTRHWNFFNADALGLLRGKYSSPVFALKVGEGAIRKSIQEQLGILKSDTDMISSISYPTLIGEIGIPFDMDGKRSYGYTDNGKYKGDYSRQERALDASLNACDGPNGLNFTVWTYCPDHSHKWSDGWNMEDLSLWSSDDLLPVGKPRGDREMKLPPQLSRRNTNKCSEDDSDDSPSKLLDSQSAVSVAAGSSFTLACATALPSGVELPVLKSQGNGNIAVTTTTNAVSSSSATLIDPQKWDTSYRLQTWSRSPFHFLTDGARAWRAFARPFPTKTVGKVSNIEFEREKAVFRMKVVVSSEDKPVKAHQPFRNEAGEEILGEDSANGAGVGEDWPATEVYVPLVHFGKESLLPPKKMTKASAAAASKDGPDEQEQSDEDVNAVPLPYLLDRSRNASSVLSSSSSSDGNGDGQETAGEVSKSRSPFASASTATLLANSSPDPNANNKKYPPYPSSSSVSLKKNDASSPDTFSLLNFTTNISSSLSDDVLDLNVSVSTGTFSVEGQTLKWWYDVPLDGEGEREYTLEVKRVGGPIKLEELERTDAGWCADLTEGGCRLM